MKQLSISQISSKLLFFSLLYVALVMPFQGIHVPLGLGIAAMLVFWLLEGQLKAKLSRLTKSWFALSLIAFYLLHLVSVLYSDNKQAAFSDVGLKLSLLICPLVLGSVASLDREKLHKVLKLFVLSSAASALVCLGYAAYQLQFKGNGAFSYAELSLFIPVGYYAMYLAFAAFLVLYHWLLSVRKFSLLHFLLIALFSVMIVMLTARAQLLTYLVIMAGIGFSFFKRKYGWLASLGVMVFFLAIFSSIAYLSPGTKLRMISAWKELSAQKKETHNENLGGISARFIIWEFGKEIIHENPIFGVGNGDADDLLVEKASQQDIPVIYQNRLNLHNQYLQTTVELGLLGLGVLLLGLLFPLIISVRSNFGIYTCFSLLIIFSFFTESVLDRQAGLIFFAFFSAFLFLNREKLFT